MQLTGPGKRVALVVVLPANSQFAAILVGRGNTGVGRIALVRHVDAERRLVSSSPSPRVSHATLFTELVFAGKSSETCHR